MLQFRGSLGPISRLGRGHTGLLFRTQVALLLAYSGTRYQGLQKNPGAVMPKVSSAKKNAFAEANAKREKEEAAKASSSE